MATTKLSLITGKGSVLSQFRKCSSTGLCLFPTHFVNHTAPSASYQVHVSNQGFLFSSWQASDLVIMLESYLHFLYTVIKTMPPSEATSAPHASFSPPSPNPNYYTTLQLQSTYSSSIPDVADAEANNTVPRCELCKQRKVCFLIHNPLSRCFILFTALTPSAS